MYGVLKDAEKVYQVRDSPVFCQEKNIKRTNRFSFAWI